MSYFIRELKPMNTDAPVKSAAADNEELPSVSDLPDDVYKGLRYGYVFELADSGKKYRTKEGTRCTRAHCGGTRFYRVHDGHVSGAVNLKFLKDGTYKVLHYLNIYELEDGSLYSDPDDIYVKQSRNIAKRNGYDTITVKNGRVVKEP